MASYWCHVANIPLKMGCGDSHVDHIPFIMGYRESHCGHIPILMRYKERFSGEIIDSGGGGQTWGKGKNGQIASRAKVK